MQTIRLLVRACHIIAQWKDPMLLNILSCTFPAVHSQGLTWDVQLHHEFLHSRSHISVRDDNPYDNFTSYFHYAPSFPTTYKIHFKILTISWSMIDLTTTLSTEFFVSYDIVFSDIFWSHIQLQMAHFALKIILVWTLNAFFSVLFQLPDSLYCISTEASSLHVDTSGWAFFIFQSKQKFTLIRFYIVIALYAYR